MMQTVLHSTPRPRDVLLGQVRAVGFALRRAALIAAALAALATLLILTDSREVVGFHPADQMLPGMVGLLLPIAVWMGEERFGAGFLWTLPVDRRRHALAKVFAGWVWLMVIVALFILWLLVLTLLSGGNILAEETIRLLPFPVPDIGTVDPGALQTVRWAPQPLLWLVPFTAATGTYLLASALALGFRHPLRWLIGAGLGFFLVAVVLERTNAEWLRMAPSRLLRSIFQGPYGVDTLLSARTESLQTLATLSTGETVLVWQGLPDIGQWMIATLVWTGVGLVALWAAASRHRECRRP